MFWPTFRNFTFQFDLLRYVLYDIFITVRRVAVYTARMKSFSLTSVQEISAKAACTVESCKSSVEILILFHHFHSQKRQPKTFFFSYFYSIHSRPVFLFRFRFLKSLRIEKPSIIVSTDLVFSRVVATVVVLLTVVVVAVVVLVVLVVEGSVDEGMRNVLAVEGGSQRAIPSEEGVVTRVATLLKTAAILSSILPYRMPPPEIDRQKNSSNEANSTRKRSAILNSVAPSKERKKKSVSRNCQLTVETRKMPATEGSCEKTSRKQEMGITSLRPVISRKSFFLQHN